MNAAHMHLLVNHLPIFASFFAVIVLAFGLRRGASTELRRIGCALFLAAAFGAAGAWATGDGAEDIVEKVPSTEHAVIHEHEEAAEAAGIATLALAGIAAALFVAAAKQKISERTATAIAFAGALLSLSALARAGYTGGEIMHPEAYAPVNTTGDMAGD